MKLLSGLAFALLIYFSSGAPNYAMAALERVTSRHFGATRPNTGALTAADFTYNTTACPGYKINSVRHTSSSLTASLSLAGPSCNAFGTDIRDLIISVNYETTSRLHVHIYDKAKKQFQIPSSMLESPGGAVDAAQSDLEFKYEVQPFAFYIVRKRTGDIIFDTRHSQIPTYSEPLESSEQGVTNSTAMPAHPLIFSNQYLQLSSLLPYNTSVYGLGEYYSGNYRRNPSSTVQPFWALDIGDPVDANMYGYHSVYQEVRPRKGANKRGEDAATTDTDTHAVWLKNSAGMDVILRDGVVQYRAIGGTFDFYFYSGDKNGLIPRRPSSPRFTNSAVNVIEQYVQTIGLPQVPPTWAFGYHQCRWGYANVSELREVVASMREANIPLETSWSDIDWMHAYRNFESDPVRFDHAEFKAFISELHSNHQHYIPIIDAAISVQVPNGTDKYDTAVRGVELGAYIMNSDADLESYPNGSGANGSGNTSTSVREYVGIVWPGYTYFPDWWAENVQEWWTEAFRNMSSFMDFDGIWLDMNEPSSFCTGSCGTDADWNNLPPSVAPTVATGWPEGYDNNTYGDSGNITVNGSWTFNPNLNENLSAGSFSFALEDESSVVSRGSGVGHVSNSSDGRLLNSPPYAIHNAHGPLDASTVAANATTRLGLIYDVKNLWGFAEEIRTHDTLLALRPNKRPFLISRSTFAGAGKYTGHWLGDNASTWRHLWHSLQGVFQFQLFGIPMVGADTCGFAQNTDEELCNRWMAMSAWHPFFRNHNVLLALSQEPYRWDSVAHVSRKVLAARYSLLPMWQTLFARASESGTPAIRTLWQEFPGHGYEGADRQFLVGDALLVTPVLVPNVSTVSGVFPAAGGPWRDFWTHQILKVQPDVNTTIPAPLSHINVHIRPGSILATYSKPAYTTYETARSPYRLIVSLDDNGEAAGEVYYDDGETQWTEHAPGSTSVFYVSKGKLMSETTSGKYQFAQKLTEVVVLGVLSKPSHALVGDDSVDITYNAMTKSLNVTSLSIDLNHPFTLSWA